MGRKSKYDPETFPMLAEGYAREGLIDEQICQKLGISHDSFYSYQKKYSEFSEAIKRGKAPVDFEVENALLKRARGYTYTETTREMKVNEKGEAQPAMIKTVNKTVIPDTGAIRTWLFNRRPDKWKDRHEVTQTVINEFENMSDEELAQAAGLDKPDDEIVSET